MSVFVKRKKEYYTKKGHFIKRDLIQDIWLSQYLEWHENKEILMFCFLHFFFFSVYPGCLKKFKEKNFTR